MMTKVKPPKKESSLKTLDSLVKQYDVDVFSYLDRTMEVPVLAGPQMQGDVSVRPVPGAQAAATSVPAEGIVLATGQGGHDHRLLPGAFFDFRRNGLVVGVLTVPADAEAYIAHDEHGYTGIAPGTYEIGTQREYAGEWRAVAD